MVPAATNSLPDTVFASNLWVQTKNTLTSVCTVVPAHEPWTTDGKARPKPQVPKGAGLLTNLATSVAVSSSGGILGGVFG